MKINSKLLVCGIAMMGLISSRTFSAGSDEELIARLKDSKLTLLEGIAYAELNSGPATSAKFELDKGNLMLSIYTAPQGLETSPELTDLTELSGVASASQFQPEAEVFTDKAHIARASVHQAIRQLSKLTLSEIIEQALKVQPGSAYSVKNPMIRNGKAVADVSIADRKGHSVQVTINVQTGDVVVN